MDKRQVLVVALLVVAIILSTTSIIMNISMNSVVAPADVVGTPEANVGVTVLPSTEEVEVQNAAG